MRNTLRCLVLLTVALAAVTGCSNDRVASVATHDCATTLTIVSQDFDRDSNLYLDKFEQDGLRTLASLERLTLQRLDASNQLTDANRAEVKRQFDAKRTELHANIVGAQKEYAVRVTVLRQVASTLLEVDKYYYARNYRTWEAVGKGAVSGIVGNLDSIASMTSIITAKPLSGAAAASATVSTTASRVVNPVQPNAPVPPSYVKRSNNGQ